MRLGLLLAVFAGACHVQAKAVFAHFMVGNTAFYTDDTWRKDVQLAKEAHISGFALNIAHGEPMNEGSLERAFNAARAENFRLIFSFDYAGRGPWPKETVISYLKKYVSRPEYFKHVDGRPLVSTFEGPGNANDWVEIKKQVDIFFMPDWSSEGAKFAVELAGGVADGLFSWAAWPWGSQDMDTYGDASYHDYLDGKPYMMPVSPWFYTNMPGYNKNWLWRGDDMWYDRWLQVIFRQPEYVQIISWNDYGESHYIGPLYDHALEAFEVGKAPFNYAIDKPHDAWRLTLPYWIDYYMSGTASLNQESLVAWYRTSSVLDCSDGGTTGNTASQLQIEFPPAVVMQDYVYFSAVLASYAEATVTVGGTTYHPKWTRIQSEKDGGMGMYHGKVYLDHPGPVTVTISRDRRTMASLTGPDYGPGSCHNGLTNWNPWVGGAVVPGSVRAVSSHSRPEQGCTQGTGAKGFQELCDFTCMYNYCPDACVCTGVGLPNEKPPEVHQDGYPARDRSENYSGLCSFACNLGYCPSDYCSPTKERIIVPATSEFLPPACIRGTGSKDGRLDGLCSYSCNFGFCPLHACRCVETGPLIKPPGQNPGTTGKARGDLNDHKLCDFACSRDWCPEDVCEFVKNGDGPVDPEEACDPRENSFSFDAPTRMGEYMRWFLMEPANAATTNRQYITIVNLTPHEFKLTYSHPFQMDHWDWDSIPPGKSRQNLAHYTETVGKNPIDSKGEVYYDIGNTGKSFIVRVTNNIPNAYTKRIIFDLTGMKKGQREYKAPEQEAPVTLVITGSDTYGFVTSLSHGPGNWMDAIKDAIAHREIINLIVPGTHDSGMSKITGAILTGATASNTQTQGLNIYDQLKVGARWLDLRVSTVHEAVNCCENYEFWTTHLNDEKASAAIGRSGEKLDEAIDEVNHFTSENPGEIIFLQFRYLIGIRNVPSLGPLYWTNNIKDEFFDKLKRINNRCPDLPENNLQLQKVGDLMAMNDGKGCVLILINTSHFRDITTPHMSPGDGIYNSHAIDWLDSWADKEDTKDVAEFVINGDTGWKNNNKSQFHVTQWLSTPRFSTSTFSHSIQAIALLPTNPALYWRGVIEMEPDVFPNVIMVDYIGMVLMNEPQWNSLSAELYTLAIGLNLYMLSEDCAINPRRSPLLPSRKNSRRPANPLVADYFGVIFANGTVWDNPPPDFHLGRDEFLQNGTAFGNSTVLHRSVRTTHFN